MKKYILSGALALALALGGLTANAQTISFTRNLTIGSSGSDVAALQTWLVGRGFAIPAISSGAAIPGYFGEQTRVAVVAYQAANGIPNTGFFGPLTRASVNAVIAGGTGGVVCPSGYTCTPTVIIPPCPTGYTCTPIGGGSGQPNLAGDFGTISDVNLLSQYSNEEVGESDDHVRVLGFEVETSDEGDIALRSVRVSFDPTGNGGSNRLNRYIDRVTLWQGDREIGSSDVENFSEDDDIYSEVITLSNAIVRSDRTEKFYVTVDTVTNLDSGDIDDDSWTVSLDNIRYEDGSGVVTTETNLGDIGNQVAINFVSFSSAADTELKISLDSDSPKEGIVIIDSDDGEDEVVMLRGNIEVEGDSDVTIDEFPVTLSVSGLADIDTAVSSVILEINGGEYRESVSTSGSTAVVTFDNMDLVLDAGETVDFTVKADINEFSGDFTAGDTLTVSVTTVNRNAIDVENEEGDELNTSSERSGTAIGRAQEFRETGMVVNLVSTNTSVVSGQSSNDDLATFRIRFSVTASGDTVYISPTTGAGGVTYVVDRAGTPVGGGTTATLINLTDDDLTAEDNYMIEEGETETFELTVTAQLPSAGTSGLYRASLTGIQWDTDDDSTPDNTYSTNLTQFRTSYVGLN